MLTKTILKTKLGDYEIPDSEFKNWADIKYTLQRKDLSGVVRSFTSKFDFVGKTYDILFSVFREDGFQATASIDFYVINNNWVYEKQFSAPLDFSTLSYDGRTLSINSVDDTLAAKIKANGKTKYEMVVGEDVPKHPFPLVVDRLTLTNSASFILTGAQSNEENANIVIGGFAADTPYISVLNSEMYENNYVLVDDQSMNGCMIEMLEDGVLSYNLSLTPAPNEVETPWNFYFTLQKKSASGDLSEVEGFMVYAYKAGHQVYDTHVGDYDTISACIAANPRPMGKSWSVIKNEDDVVYEFAGSSWQNTGMKRYDYLAERMKIEKKGSVSLSKGDKLYLSVLIYDAESHNIAYGVLEIMDSLFEFKWKTKALTFMSDIVAPQVLANTLLSKIAPNINVSAEISDSDYRMDTTYLMAAESLRGIKGAKLYTSFDDFCEWMGAVFGYTYYIAPLRAGFSRKQYVAIVVDSLTYLGADEATATTTEAIDDSSVVYVKDLQRFVCIASDGVYYKHWPTESTFNDATTDKARTDTLFYYKLTETTFQGFYFDGEQEFMYNADIDSYAKPFQRVRFLSRDELFGGNNIKRIDEITDFSFTIDSSLIYSGVHVGYNKVDYNRLNGRDEWNFDTNYTTGVTVTDKTLELISPYRADCYGIEFTAQERGSDSSDTDADEDIFFVLAERNGNMVIRRLASVYNSANSGAYNGEYNPMVCARKNAFTISAMANGGATSLWFASTSGNAEIRVDHDLMSNSLLLDKSKIQASKVKFKCGDLNVPEDWQTIIEIDNGGYRYRGHISKVDVGMGKESVVSYELITKSIEKI